jgi:hypothetical protein
MRGAITPLPQYAFMEWCSVKTKSTETTLLFMVLGSSLPCSQKPDPVGFSPELCTQRFVLIVSSHLRARLTSLLRVSGQNVVSVSDIRHAYYNIPPISSFSIQPPCALRSSELCNFSLLLLLYLIQGQRFSGLFFSQTPSICFLLLE